MPKGLKDFVPELRRGYCDHASPKGWPPDMCPHCCNELADLIESILKLWQERRALEDIDPTDLM